jgi:prepilin-type processing-associated H-X9-DG protein
MKQLGLALHNYHDTYKVFPSATYSQKACSTAAGFPGSSPAMNASGWLTALPFFEQASIADRYNKNECVSWAIATAATNPAPLIGDPQLNGNGPLVCQKLPIFICPSNPTRDFFIPLASANSAFYCVKPNSNLQGARTNYDFAVNCETRCNHWSAAAQNVKRMFGENSNTNLGMVIDGTSNTIMIGETTLDVVNGEGNAWGFRGWVMIGVDPACQLQTGRGINIWYRATGANLREPGRLGSWAWAGSLHPGGCNFVMGDGSVTFVSETISFTVLRDLSAMSDGNPVQLP